MHFSLNFVKYMGNFCKVFTAFKQVRDSTFFLYQIAGILRSLSTTILFWYLSKVSILTVPKSLSGVIKWNMINFMSKVYHINMQITLRGSEANAQCCQSIPFLHIQSSNTQNV